MGRTVEEFFTLPQWRQDRWNNVVHAVTKMRSHGVSLPMAAQEFGVSPETVLRLAGSALRRSRNGRYVAKPRDTLLRVVDVLTEEDVRAIALRDSRLSSLVGAHWSAAGHYLQTGDASRLRQFRRRVFMDTDGERFSFLTDLDELDRRGNRGGFSLRTCTRGNARKTSTSRSDP